MNILTIIGFVGVFVCAIYATVVAVSIAFGELVFSGGFSPLSFVFAAIVVGLWGLVCWLSPFTISLGFA